MINIEQVNAEQMRTFQKSLTRFMMYYRFGLEEVNTKINILKQEFEYVHDYNPIEHVKSRLKTPESIINKLQRKNYPWSVESIRENIRDIAGIRITCSFVPDIYRVAGMLMQQQDITVLDYKDYIEEPKPNGYQSLHMILQVPVFMSDRMEKVFVEVQIRTIAMDFWASLEHKIYYKYEREVPQQLKDDLKEAADTVAQLDRKMEQIHQEMLRLKASDDEMLLQQEPSSDLVGKSEDRRTGEMNTGEAGDEKACAGKTCSEKEDAGRISTDAKGLTVTPASTASNTPLSGNSFTLPAELFSLLFSTSDQS
ncbi:GTP pyrophosphokinase [Anoxynatronum buryatiense]|uniref:GTP pyrophosphokinase n=1 Tax=Anoxynatronum buryatiense TaxID=489973 RepID=A0AA45WWM2_9CLOT|nr:GTP pyrophosphokinase family protein [Anoxynatronum buryatiense]SMP58595.1 putative GTP pyrophosphokinase [Anoxynatronum buryatiense]